MEYLSCLKDFVVTALFAVLWVLATIAWWAGANGVGFMTGTESIEKNLATRDDACKVNDGDDFRCKVTGDWGYGSLVISVVCALFSCRVTICFPLVAGLPPDWLKLIRMLLVVFKTMF